MNGSDARASNDDPAPDGAMDDPTETATEAPAPDEPAEVGAAPADTAPADTAPADTGPADTAPAPAAPAPILLDAAAPVTSALDTIDAARQETEPFALDEILPDWVPTPPARIRGQPFVRPVASALHRPGEPGSARVGAVLGHRYWLRTDRPVTFGGEERLSLTAPLGGARGYGFSLAAVNGPWVGPVGLRVGPIARVDRLDWGADVLPFGVGVGALAELAVELGKVSLTGAVEPVWLVAGRSGTGGAVGELGARAGFGWLGRPFHWFLEGGVRTTAVGPIYEGGLSVALRVF